MIAEYSVELSPYISLQQRVSDGISSGINNYKKAHYIVQVFAPDAQGSKIAK